MLDADARFQRCLNFLWRPDIEGGYANHPGDKGGPTKKGATLAALSRFLGRPLTDIDVQNMSDTVLAAFFRVDYWTLVKGDALPAGVDLITFDCAVNQGPGRAARWLQEAAGAEPDGHIGPNTLARVAAADPQAVVTAMAHYRDQAYRDDPQFAVFGRGWEARLAKCVMQAEAWLKGG